MKKGYRYLLHLFYWFLFFGWRELATALFSKEPAFQYPTPFYIGGFIVFMTPFYINYLLVMPRYFRRNELRKCWAGWGALLMFFIGFRYFIEEYLFLHLFGTHNYGQVTPLFYAFDNVYYGLNTILASIFIWAVINWRDLENEKRIVAREKNEAELNLLKSQVNPHFLFNTLNNIYSLVYQKSEQALPAILRLSGLMRFMTNEAASDKIGLDKEIEYIRSFIELESLRTTQPAQIDLKISGDIGSQPVAPLILIPFVENGFKHGIVTDESVPFIIHITLDKKTLTLFAKNKVNPNTNSSQSGIGLANVRKRLDLLYTGRYDLQIKQLPDTYICNLTIKL